ncbi:MAG: GTP-binding protein [Promethearchaeota archaeon]
MEEYDYLFKVIVLGDGGVGKTAMTVRFSQGYFQESYKMTVGVDFSVKLIQIPSPERTFKVKLQVWDTGGQERFSFVRPLYYRGAMGALLVFDVSNRESFDHLPNWIEEMEANTEPVPYVLVGNKVDLPREVSSEEAWEFAKQFNIKYYYETSAKTGEAVGDCFHALAYEMVDLPLPVEAYPAIMKKMGLVPGMSPQPATPAVQAPPVVPPVPEPQFSAGMSQATPDFSAADEYAEMGMQQSPSPSPISIPKPDVKPLGFNQPPPKPSLPSIKPLSIPSVSTSQQSSPSQVPSVKPLPSVQSLPEMKPLSTPKPMPIKVEPQPKSNAAVGLFQAVNKVQIPESPVQSPQQSSANVSVGQLPKPTPVRVPKPIPITKKDISEALPELSKHIQASSSSTGPIVFTPDNLSKQASTPQASEVSSVQPSQPSTTATSAQAKNTSSFYLTQALSAKTKDASASTTSSSSSRGFIPFSSGFSTSGFQQSDASSSAKSGAIGFFIQRELPEDFLKPKKRKKGSKVSLVKCPGCGNSVRATMKFCNKCGTRLK